MALDGGPPISTSLTQAETDELVRLARGVAAMAIDARVVEIGSAFGYSAIAMALTGACVLSIDPHDGLHSFDVFHHNLRAYGVADRVEVRVGRSQDILPTLHTRYYGLVFIDGDHGYEAVRYDLWMARQLVKPYGAVIACHDYGEETCPGVRMALDEWRPPDHLVDTLAVYGDPRWP